ncbi:unnamed protein product [Amaranthus hypochondriacus]
MTNREQFYCWFVVEGRHAAVVYSCHVNWVWYGGLGLWWQKVSMAQSSCCTIGSWIVMEILMLTSVLMKAHLFRGSCCVAWFWLPLLLAVCCSKTQLLVYGYDHEH